LLSSAIKLFTITSRSLAVSSPKVEPIAWNNWYPILSLLKYRLNRLTNRIMMGESENVAKKAVDEHNMRGSLLFRSPKARLKVVA
jgi:hypothetical protein